jgi:hypothetical protein
MHFIGTGRDHLFADYLGDIVEPTVTEFEKHPTSRRHAFMACLATFQTVDYLAEKTGENKGNLYEMFRKQSPDFKVVERVANAFKHVVTKRRSMDELWQSKVIPRPPSFVGEMVVGLSFIGDTRGGVTIWGEHSVELFRAVKQTVAFLRSQV